MTEEPSQNNPPATAPKKRLRFSLKLLIVVMTLAAAVTAFGTNYPALAAAIAVYISFVACVKVAARRTIAGAERAGRSSHRKTFIVVFLSLSVASWIWVAVYGSIPAMIIGLILTLSTSIIWFAGFDNDNW